MLKEASSEANVIAIGTPAEQALGPVKTAFASHLRNANVELFADPVTDNMKPEIGRLPELIK